MIVEKNDGVSLVRKRFSNCRTQLPEVRKGECMALGWYLLLRAQSTQPEKDLITDRIINFVCCCLLLFAAVNAVDLRGGGKYMYVPQQLRRLTQTSPWCDQLGDMMREGE